MRTLIPILLIINCFLFTCKSRNNSSEGSLNIPTNELLVSKSGDSVEIGYWIYHNESNEVSKKGLYEKGFKVEEWKYFSAEDSVSIHWKIFETEEVKFNYPGVLNLQDSVEYPILFLGDIVDDDDDTYIAILKYDLSAVNSSVYGYLYQYDQLRENDSIGELKSKEVTKFNFKDVELFKYHVELVEKGIPYVIISYIFEVDGILYDLTYKNSQMASNNIYLELINDMLYSIECKGIDLFSYNSRKYYKQENVTFE